MDLIYGAHLWDRGGVLASIGLRIGTVSAEAGGDFEYFGRIRTVRDALGLDTTAKR